MLEVSTHHDDEDVDRHTESGIVPSAENNIDLACVVDRLRILMMIPPELEEE